MDTQKIIARLRERAATQDACGCWSLDRAAADELERLASVQADLKPAIAPTDGGPVAVTAVYRADSDCPYVGATEAVKCAWADGWNQCAQFTKGSHEGY